MNLDQIDKQELSLGCILAYLEQKVETNDLNLIPSEGRSTFRY